MTWTSMREQVRRRASRPLSPREFAFLNGPLAGLLLRVGDIPLLLFDALGGGLRCSDTVAGKTFAKRAVRRRLERIVGAAGAPLAAQARVRAIACLPEWSRMGRSFFGMTENYYDPAETEILALLALWVGEGTSPRPGPCVLTTSYRPPSRRALDLLEWRELDEEWDPEQIDLLETLLRDGVTQEYAIEISRNPGWRTAS